MTTYHREKPCRKCGSHDFYVNNQHCAACVKANNADYRQRSSSDHQTELAHWHRNNLRCIKDLDQEIQWAAQNGGSTVFSQFITKDGGQ